MRQGVCDLYFRAFPIVPVVFYDEVYHPWAVGLKVASFVSYWWVYLASCVLCFVGLVVGAMHDEDVRRRVLWGTLPVRHGLGCLGERGDGGRQCGFSDLGHHAWWRPGVYGRRVPRAPWSAA